MPEYLDQDIKFLAGVGPKRAELLDKELGIKTFRDLLYYFPYKYIDRTKFHSIAEVRSNQAYIQVKGKIRSFELQGERHKQRLTAVFYDDTGSMDLLWFQGIKYIRENLVPGKTYVVFGKPSVFNGRVNIIHPEIEDKQSEEFKTGILQAFYNTTEKLKKRFLNTRALNKIQFNLARQIEGKVYETLPAKVRDPLKLMPLKDCAQANPFS